MVLETDIFIEHGMTVQDTSVLLGFDLASERLAFFSRNARCFLGVASADDWIACPMSQILGGDVTHSVRNVQTLPTLAHRPQTLGLFQLGQQHCAVMVFRTADFIVLELIPASSDREPSAIAVLNDVRLVADAILGAADLGEMFGRLTSLVRTLSGYHCVQVHQLFDADKSTRLASSGRDILVDLSLGCPRHFSFVADAFHSGQALVKFEDDLRVPSLDLATMRTISGGAAQSLREQEVAACATISFGRRGRIWGVLQMLHQGGRMPNRRTQLVLEHLAPLIEQRLGTMT